MKNYEKLQEQGKTVMIFGTAQNILAIIAVADDPDPELYLHVVLH